MYLCMKQQTVTAENFESVGTAVLNIVSGLDEKDEQSEDNLDIIADVYENITELLHSGQIVVTENVRILKNFGCYTVLLFADLLIVCREHCECCEWHFWLARGSCKHTVFQVITVI